jgi:hypothetical protein
MEDSRETARALIEQHAIGLEDLWVHYWANGGSVEAFEFDAYLNGAHKLDPLELKILAWAMEDLNAG